MEVFLSYNFEHEPFVRLVHKQLSTQPAIRSYFYSENRRAGEWEPQLREALKRSDACVFFVGPSLGAVQRQEVAAVRFSGDGKRILWVKLTRTVKAKEREFFQRFDPIILQPLEANPEKPDVTCLSEPEMQPAAELCAREILRRLNLPWKPPFDLPRGYPFDYEKRIIDAFIEGKGRLHLDKIDEGCTEIWPAVVKRAPSDEHTYRTNPVPEEIVGDHREPDASIVVDARAKKLRGEVQEIWEKEPGFLTFPEAGPREQVCYPLPTRSSLKVGILVSGGIAPGINAVIDGIVKRHHLYMEWDRERKMRYRLDVLGLVDGLQGLLHGTEPIRLTGQGLAQIDAHSGGSFLRTSREDELINDETGELMSKIVDRLTTPPHQVDILYLIGGDGSMRAAHAIYTLAREKGADLSVVTIPKTMDNDILWVWQSFGFLSAVEWARQAILQLHVEASSNPRLCIIQLFGSDSGFIASHAALSSGVCDYVLIPEVGFNLSTVVSRMIEKLRDLRRDGESPHGMVVMAETAIPRDYARYYKNVGLTAEEKAEVDAFVLRGGRVHGQTPDLLRTAALKIVAETLRAEIRRIRGSEREQKYWRNFRIFSNEPRHLIRAIPPSTSDVIFGERLGTLAVDAAMAGYSDCMVSQWLTEYVLVPLKLVILGRKRVPPKGIFWRTVLANTGQPDEDLGPWPGTADKGS